MNEGRYSTVSEPSRYLGRGLAASDVFLYLGAMIILYRLPHAAVFEP